MTAEPERAHGETARSLGALSTAGLSFVFAIVLGPGAGILLDGWLGTSPWFFLLGFALRRRGGGAQVCSRRHPSARARIAPGTAS